MPRRLRNLPEEVWFFLRIAAYAFFIGTLYWVLTYEPAGTMLLFGFGFAAGFAMLILGISQRNERRNEEDARASGEQALEPDGPFGDESGRIPSPSIAPFGVAAGAALIGLGLIFGLWFLMLGLIFFILAGAEWLIAAQRELDAIERQARRRTE